MRSFFVFLALVTTLLTPASALAERIPLFESMIRVNDAGELIVVERIDYDFEGLERRGIFRDIPLRFTLGGERRAIMVSDVGVRSLQGDPLLFRLEDERGSMLRIRIGDPEKIVTGVQTYVISYTVTGALLFLSDYDEVYWNVTGNEWAVPIDIARAQVILGFSGADILQAACYSGARGEARSCSAEQLHADNVRYEILQERIQPGGGVTIAVGFPKGLIAESVRTFNPFEQLFRILFLVPGLLIAIWAYMTWRTRGRDPDISAVYIRHYTPPEGLSPAEAGVVVDGVAHRKDIIAQLIELARAGFFTIHQFEKKLLIFTQTDYLLEQHHASDDLLYSYDRLLLDALFKESHMSTEEINGRQIKGVVLSSLSNKLVSEMSRVERDLYETVAKRGFFEADPQRVRQRWVAGSVLVGVLGFGAVILVPFLQSIMNAVGVAIAALAIGTAGFGMPVRTREGVRMKEHLLGLREYLAVAEKDRLAFHNSPNSTSGRTPEEFDALLPYAMIFGVEKAWASQFEHIFKEPPSWYAPAPGHSFSPSFLVADMQGFASSVNAASTSASSGGSGGGGSSGGGAGGGGGGSW